MNIYLVGYRGTGKTTLGKKLSKRLRMKFVDMDSLIEEREKRKIEKIFADNGEKYFREVEKKILLELSEKSNLVVSTGGGVVILPENRKTIKDTGIAIYLNADDAIIYERIKNDRNRPPLTSKPLLEEIKHLLSIRKPFYEEVADITINTSNLSIDECINKIIDFLNRKGIVV